MRNYIFKDEQFVSAKDKQLILKDWIRFCKSISEGDQFVEFVDKYGNTLPVAFKYFTDRLYKHLSLHCSFIAHYNRYGFYQTYFDEGENVEKFFKQFDEGAECVSVEYGGTYWRTGQTEDLNKALVAEAKPFLKKIYVVSGRAQRAQDIGQAQVLLAKHGISIKGE